MALPMRMGVWSSWSMARVLQQEVEYYYYYYKTVTSSQPKQTNKLTVHGTPGSPAFPRSPALRTIGLTNLYWMSILNNIYIHSFNQDTIIYVTLMNSVLVSGIVKITQIFVT